jgi:arylsulfatase/arylsulfatase A
MLCDSSRDRVSRETGTPHTETPMRYFFSLAFAVVCSATLYAAPPNVVLVMTDDQGFGDLGAHGNPIVKTPKLDAFTKEAAWLKNFYVSPVCSPTRSSLLTGQYNYRTGIVDTYLGRSLMRPDVRTLAEILSASGYRTGLFGKWHLGDNYPLRPEDRGFQETLYSLGGGLAQPSDIPPTGNTQYFDPNLRQNGKEIRTEGYCTDIFTNGAIKFIEADNKKPFFAYIAYNAPHGPYQVPEELVKPYAKLDLSEKAFPKVGQPWATGKTNPNAIAKAYAMIENIDTNFGRLMKTLEEKKLADNTIVIFLTDNGPGDVRWNAGLRNRKGTVYEGGVRVPCYVRWPAKVKAGHVVETALAHIDMTPTLAELCGAKADTTFDGRSFAKLLTGEPGNWPSRTLFIQWHRGDQPEKYRGFMARGDKYKLVQANGIPQNAKWQPKYELFDITADPFEEKDLASTKPDEVAQLKREYEAWFADVTKKGFAPPRIVLGNEKENPTRLSRQDWRGPKAEWKADSIGHWEVKFDRPGKYKVTIHSNTEFANYTGNVGPFRFSYSFSDGTVYKVTESFEVPKAGNDRIEITVSDLDDKNARGPQYVVIEYVGPLDKK